MGNPRRGRQARNFTTNAPKILDLKSSSEQIFSRKLPLGAPDKKKVTWLNDSNKKQTNKYKIYLPKGTWVIKALRLT